MKTKKKGEDSLKGSVILKILLIHLDMNPNRFASSLGMKRAQGIYDILDGTVGISKNMAEKILLAFPQVNKDWLATGSGEIEKPEKRGVARLLQLVSLLAIGSEDPKAVRERLKEIIGRLQERYTLEEIFRLLGIKPFDGTYRLTEIDSYLGLAVALQTKFDVNPEFLNNGKGDMFTDMDDDLIQLNRQPDMVPFLPIGSMLAYARSTDKDAFIEKLPKYALPPRTESSGARWMYFEMDNDSMEPSISKHDIIVATQVHKEDWQGIRDLTVFAIVTKDEVVIRRLMKGNDHTWEIVSDYKDAFSFEPVKLAAIKELWIFRRLITSKMEVVKIPNGDMHRL